MTRIDLATDIFDISHKKIFPDFAKERYQMITNSKNAPKLNMRNIMQTVTVPVKKLEYQFIIQDLSLHYMKE